jgi:hypothetical protein
MTNPTSNFGWQMPTNTDLVTNLPADFEVFGQAVDSSMADLKGGTTGQVLSKTTNADMDFTWIANDQGDITGVTAGTGISGGGTSGNVTVTNSMATAIDAKGDLIAGTGADTFARLAAGTDGYVLVTDSTAATGLKWTAAVAGDITAVNVTSPITGGGTSGDVTIAIQDASTTQRGSVQLSDSTSTTSSILAATPTAVKAAYDKASTAATTSVAGIVQLSDSTSTTSSVLASTPTATKSAYDLANAAIAKSTVTTTGDIIYRNATVPTRLGIGTTGQVLTVAAGIPSWATPSASASFATGYNYVATSQSTTSTTYTGLTTAGAVTVTTGTKALVSISGSFENGAGVNVTALMSFAISGATTVAASDQYSTGLSYVSTGGGNFQTKSGATFVVTGLTAGSNTFTTQFRKGGGDTPGFSARTISVVDLGS